MKYTHKTYNKENRVGPFKDIKFDVKFLPKVKVNELRDEMGGKILSNYNNVWNSIDKVEATLLWGHLGSTQEDIVFN